MHVKDAFRIEQHVTL